MPLTISAQKVNTWTKRIQKDGLKGSTYFLQEGKLVAVSASADHQVICKKVLGIPTGKSTLDSYIRWDNVQATNIVELLYQIEKA